MSQANQVTLGGDVKSQVTLAADGKTIILEEELD